MKFVTYSVDTAFGSVDRLGAVVDGEVLDLNAAYEARLAASGEPDASALAALLLPSSLLGLLRREERGMEAAHQSLAFAQENSTARM